MVDAITPEAAALSVLLDCRPRRTVRQLIKAHGNGVAALATLETRHRRAMEKRLRACRRSGIGLVCESDPEFPPLLRCIPDAPLILHYRGALSALAGASAPPAIAVVGARRASRFGRDVARRLAEELVGRGFAVVSGLALGVDGAAHAGALAAAGCTIAVLGSGLDRIRPLAHGPLAAAMLEGGGALVSEYPPGVPPAPFRFPERNRLISGLSVGVVVVEASARSGSLITARLAHDQGRDVMAVPNPPGLPNSAGVNGLLKTGAALIESAEDVLDALGVAGARLPGGASGEASPAGAAPSAGGLTPELARLLDGIDSQPRSVDEIAQARGMSVARCSAALIELELGGFVQRLADGYIRRPSEF